MKKSIYSTFIVALIFSLSLDGFGQGKKLQETYSWKYEVNDDVKLSFNNYECDLIIHTWDKPGIEYKMSVDATLRSGEDAGRLDKYLNNLEFSHSAGSVDINNRYWRSRKSVMGRKTMDIAGEKTIRYTDYNMKGELWIPRGCNLNLTSKYSGIELEEIDGRVSLELYNDKLYGDNVNQFTRIVAKYSSLEFDDMKDIEADLYNTDMEAGTTGNLNITSKYSKINIGDAEEIDIHAYSDKYSFGNTADIKFIDKYSVLTTGITGNVELDCYNSTVTCDGTENIELKSKYGNYEIGKANNLRIESAYNDTYRINSLKTLNVTASKYGSYKIQELNSSLVLDDGYSDKITVTESGAGLSGIRVDGKYVKVEMALSDDLDFRFKANVKYPNFDINEEDLNVVRKIQESSNLELEAIKGTEKENMPSFLVNGYDMAVTFTWIP